MLIYPFVNHFHSIVRWLLLSGLMASLLLSLYSMFNRIALTPGGRIVSRLTLYLAHAQFLVGLVLYLISPKVIFSANSMQSPILRFFLVEHITVMVLSIALITFGYVLMKRSRNPLRSGSRIFWFYLISLLMILAMIPWPFTSFGGHWI
jgi:hypothetical protein